jgi:glycosyltransferase involved in cell wall biosynthesis
MSTISLCMIVKNEESVLGRCLDSVKDIVDEIIIVDTGSSDKTKEIAAKYTNRIYDFEWIDDFSAARNFSFEKATSEWIMWLDADDIITLESQKVFSDFKKNRLSTIAEDCIHTRYDITFDSKGNIELGSVRERLFKRNKNPKWRGRVHEVVSNSDFKGVLLEGFSITHKKESFNSILNERNLNIYKKMIQEGIELETRDLYHLAVEYFNINYYLEAIKYFKVAIEKDLKLQRSLFIQATIYLSECYIQTQQFNESLNILFDFLKESPPNKGVILKISKTYWEQLKVEEALKWCQMSLGIEEKYIGLLFDNREEWMEHQQIAKIYFSIGDYKNALKHNRILIEKFPDQPGFLENEKQIKEKMNSKKER